MEAFSCVRSELCRVVGVKDQDLAPWHITGIIYYRDSWLELVKTEISHFLPQTRQFIIWILEL